MNYFFIPVIVCFFSVTLYAGDTLPDDYIGTPGLRYENYIYQKNIHTVQLHDAQFELSAPLLRLGSDQRLKLSFDDLDPVLKTYHYTIIHCTADWMPSDLSPVDYLEGFTENAVNEYDYSFNTLTHYVHYNVVFPNENVRLTKSGNYLIKVFEDSDQEKLVLTRRFMVFDERVTITIELNQPGLIDDKYYKQKIDFVINHQGYEIANPYSDLKVVITQNDRVDNAITKLKPLFVKDHELVYRYDEDNVFNGGNEFRNFDTRSLRYQSERIASVKTDSSLYTVTLTPDERRPFKRYSTIDDINGKYLIKAQDVKESEREGDYVRVHFFLPYPEPFDDGNLYVVGGLSDWRYSSFNKMIYNYKRFGYEVSLLLKQGYYNYQYIFLKDKALSGDETIIEGNHYETENDYTIYVYYRAPGVFYDQLIAIKKINSRRGY